MMRKLCFAMSELALFIALALVFSASARVTPGDSPSGPEQTYQDTHSVTGTIAAVSRTSFTLNLGSAFSGQDTQKSVTFLLDKNTTVDGKLRVGEKADVTYRDNDGKYVAISVRVTPVQN
jgi:hypothetical protein